MARFSFFVLALAAIGCLLAASKNVTIKEVGLCLNQQCILGEGTSSFVCPTWDTNCSAAYKNFTDCYNGDKVQDCVNGRLKLKDLTLLDIYPAELVSCTKLCKKEVKTTNSYFLNYAYNCKLGCQQDGAPIPPRSFNTLQAFNSCNTNSCKANTTLNYTTYNTCQKQDNLHNVYAYCQDMMQKLNKTDKLPFCHSNLLNYCQGDPTYLTKDFKLYFSCVQNCETGQGNGAYQTAALHTLAYLAVLLLVAML